MRVVARTAADDALRLSAANHELALVMHEVLEGRRSAGGQDGGEVEHESLFTRSFTLCRLFCESC